MEKGIFISLLCLLVLSSSAQLVNNGGVITIQQGASLVCEGSLVNTGGTIANDGRIEVKGAFSNTGTYNSTGSEDSLILSGSNNVVLSLGGATVNYLTINKSASTDVVTLGNSVTVNKKLDYLSGVLSTDYAAHPTYVLSAPKTAVFNFAAGKEIIGSVKRTGWSNGSSAVFNSPQTQITTNSGTAPTDITVTMLPEAYGGDPSQAEREVKRKFLFAQTGGSGFTADVRFPYAAGELNTNTEANLVPWTLASNEWNARLTPVTRNIANKWVATTGIAATSFMQEWKLADPNYVFTITAHLRGAWNAGTQTMNTTLNASGQLPLSQPYNIAPFNYSGTESVVSIPNANIVDWVLLDFRKPLSGLAADANSATAIGQKAAFLLKNGSVVDLDGVTPLTVTINKQGAGFVVVRHRNHLAAMSNPLPSNAAGTFTNDFSSLVNAYSKSGLSNLPLQALPSSAKYGLWSGNANRDVVINASDIGLIKSQANKASTGYQFGDVNLDQTVNASDVGLAKLSANAAATSHSARTTKNTVTTSHVPAD